MINEPPSEKRHPLEAPPAAAAPENASAPAPNARRTHPLEAPDTPPRPREGRRQRLVVAFPMRRADVTYVLIALNITIFVLGLVNRDLRALMVENGTIMHAAIFDDGQYYRLFTAMFLHADLAHLFLNMYALYIIGRSLEWLFGRERFLLVYLLGGLGGSALMALTMGANGYGLGASGAIFAIWGAEMVYLYQNRRTLGTYAMMQLRQIIMFAALNLVLGLLNPFIGTWAHIGGLLGGLALTWWLGPRLVTGTHPDYPDAVILAGVRFEPAALPVSAYIIALVGLLLIGTLR